MKKGILISLSTALLLLVLGYVYFMVPFPDLNFSKEEPDFRFRTRDKKIQILDQEDWKDFEIKGVNMGSGYPGYFPNDDGIDKDTYYRWFEMIAGMNANTVRVYKQQSPDFYAALYEYNKKNEKKLYLIQTVDFPDAYMYSDINVFDSTHEEELFESTRRTVDVLHGKTAHLNEKNERMDLYVHDVSEYVLGYILGVEWDDTFVEYINSINNGVSYKGEYLSTEKGSSPFEAFLAKWGDELFTYETDTYHTQHLVSYGNWADTDPFINEIQVEERKDIESEIDTDHVLYNDKVKTGMFASYNIYPYYPLFLQYGPYTKYLDETGNPNPYRKYLMELVEHHNNPVVVTEYGIPSSRSIAHDDIWRSFSHGGMNETEQAVAIAELYQDIKKAGCAGSMVFSWQDEWYKRAWNEMALSDPDKRAFWNNVQCAEQLFGILSFDPGEEGKAIYPDGNKQDWEEKDFVMNNGKTKISMKEDEKYLHILAEGLDTSDSDTYLNLALDITPKSGESKIGKKEFEQPVDFLIRIGKNGESALYVDQVYDVMIYSIFSLYYDNTLSGLDRLKSDYANTAIYHPESSKFSMVSRPDNHEKEVSSAKPTVNAVGKLKKGNANPESKDYDSNADYYLGDNFVEIRIPWQLINFRDPSQNIVIDDLEENDYAVKGLKIHEIHISPYFNKDQGKIQSAAYQLRTWKEPQYHERTKEVYDRLKEAFGEE